MFQVKKAQRQRRPLKVNLEGLSGSGKTFTALRLAFAMKKAGIGNRIVIADSENDSAGLYAGTQIDGETWDYETVSIPHEVQNPDGYAKCYEYLVEQKFDIIIMDSLTHAWHGAMQMVDDYSQRNKGDKFGGWAQVTPAQRHMLSTLTDNRAHLIATMRVKSEYERVAGANGKDKIKKVGMKTDQRDGAEYEFDVVVRMDDEHGAHIEKVRGCTALDGKHCVKPGPDFWKPLFSWWLTAEPILSIPERIAKCATLPDLGTLWNGLTPAEQKQHLAAKDKRKADLQAASEGEQGRPPSANGAPTTTTAAPNGANAGGAPNPPSAANASSTKTGHELPKAPARGPTVESVCKLLDAVAEVNKEDGAALIGIMFSSQFPDAADLTQLDPSQLSIADKWLRERASGSAVPHATA